MTPLHHTSSSRRVEKNDDTTREEEMKSNNTQTHTHTIARRQRSKGTRNRWCLYLEGIIFYFIHLRFVVFCVYVYVCVF